MNRIGKRRKLRLFLLVIWVFFSAGFAGAEADFSIERLVVGTTMSVKSIDIDDYYFGTLRAMLTHLSLVNLDEKGEFYGALAESWATKDGKTWTFSLRKGLLWHDDRPVTARDVAFTITYLLEKVPVYKSHLSLVESVAAPDDHTVMIHLSRPNPRFLVNLLVVRILPRHCFESIADPKTFTGGEAAIGCGPYRFDSFDPASGTIGFTAFPKYYRGRPRIRQIVFRSYRNPDVLYMALRKGEIDLPYFYAAGTPAFHVPPLLKDPNIRIQLMDNIGVPNALFLNTQKPPADQADFRRALSHAINYEELIRFFAAGYGSVPNGGFVPRGAPEFVETEPLIYNPERAVKLLETLGYVDVGADGFRRANGKIAELELVVRTDVTGSLRLTELLKEYFQKIGVKLTLRPVDMATFSTLCDRERSHMALLSRATPWGMMMWAGCGTGYLDQRNIGWSAFVDPGFVSIVDRMNETLDRGQYLKVAAEFQQCHAKLLPAIPLYWDALIQPYHRRFEGWKVSPVYGFLWEETWFNLREATP
ncbi:MAG: ABC transporter substrate-binding protein [Pseudomonadota bacterium]